MRSVRLCLVSITFTASLFALACTQPPADGGAAAERAPSKKEQTPSPAPSTKEPVAPSEREPASKQAPKPKIDEAAKLRKHLLVLLNEGRALTKKGDYPAGMAKYREALEIDASDVTVLGELGWAAYKAGELEDAHRTTAQALKFAREDKQRGMLLYNLGRVEEDRNNTSVAIEHYQASLAARPGNETVKARLEKLESVQNQMASAGSAGGELEGPDRVAGLEPLGRELADLAAACKLIEERRCEDYTLDGDDLCRCEPNLQATPGADDSWGLLQLGQEYETMQVAWFPAVKTDKGWTVFSEVLYSYNPGAFGIFEQATLKPSTVETLLAKGTQLVMRFSKARLDRDMGLNEVETEDYEGMVICARHQTGAYCTRALLTSYKYLREVEFPEADAEIAGEEIEHEGLPIEFGFVSSVELRDAKLIVTRTEVTGGFDRDGELWGAFGWILPAGEHLLVELLGLPD